MGAEVGLECNNLRSVNVKATTRIVGKAVPVIGNQLTGRDADIMGVGRFVIGFRPVDDDSKIAGG